MLDSLKVGISTGCHVPQKDRRRDDDAHPDLTSHILVDTRPGGSENVACKAVGRAVLHPVFMRVNCSPVSARFFAISDFRGEWDRWRALRSTAELCRGSL